MSLKAHLQRLRDADLSEDFACLNALQHTAWTINKPVLAVARELWNSGQAWAGLPARDDLPLPEYPFDKDPKQLSFLKDDNGNIEL